jgi:hypothetical protein
VLHHFLRDLSRADDRFSFLKPQYFNEAVADDGTDDAKKKREDALRKFRQEGKNV